MTLKARAQDSLNVERTRLRSHGKGAEKKVGIKTRDHDLRWRRVCFDEKVLPWHYSDLTCTLGRWKYLNASIWENVISPGKQNLGASTYFLDVEVW